ncbi:MAG: hypothetical protein FIA93_11080 [Deltaproteobacteria bacterium]|nr:hypothetical protein [Deltaproteobacteria bacterium]PWB65538.1 MAG: hypothetical protein C3F14_05350 [Deltaproteobacteria bacterium]
MIRHPVARPRIAVAVALAALLAASAATAADTTAKAGFASAATAAQQWQKDAVLVNVSTLQADADGKAAKWGYMYYSPKSKRGYTVDVKGGKVVETLEVNPYVRDAVGEFVDSDKAMAEARKSGLKIKGKTPMSLMMMGQATKSPGVYWSVSGGIRKGDVSVLVDGKTGKFSYKQAMP